MDKSLIMKKIVSFILIGLVLFFTLLALLGIWDIINLEQVMSKLLYSLLTLFASSAVILFIFSVLIKDDNNSKPNQ
jgi:hypothetical protein